MPQPDKAIAGPNWQLIAKVLGTLLLGVVVAVTGYVVMAALEEPGHRRDADDEIRAITATLAGAVERLTGLVEAQGIELTDLSATVDEMHPPSHGPDGG